jgi:hypothetical protein
LTPGPEAAATGAPGPTQPAPGEEAGAEATLPPNAATVNGEPITIDEFQRELARARAYFIGEGVVDPATDEGKAFLSNVAQQVLEQQLIAQMLVNQAAAREGLVVTDEQIQKAIKEMEDQVGGKDAVDSFLAGQNMTRDDLIKMQRNRLLTEALQAKVIAPLGDTADQVHARHLQVASKEEAEKALARIKAGEDFAKVANEVSQDATTNIQGGDLGWFARGVMPAEIETIAFSLPPDGLSEVFQTAAGWHVLQVIEHDTQHPLTDEMKDAIREQAFDGWLRGERERATIEIFVK